MSLIGDALRKARQETPPARGAQSSSRPPAWRREAGRGLRKTMALGLLLGALAAVAGGAGVWFLRARAPVSPRIARETSQAGLVVAPATAVPSAAPTQGHRQRPISGANVAPVPAPAHPGFVTSPARHSSTTPGPAVGRGREHVDDPETGAPAPEPASVSGQHQAQPGEHAGAVAGQPVGLRQKALTPKNVDAVGEAQVGSVKLSLEYIVYRSNNPFAQINGQEAHIGTDIDGFIVKDIQLDYVLLLGETGEKVTLRVR